MNGSAWSWQDFTVFPGDEVWGNRMLPELNRFLEPDTIVTLLDVWVLEPKMIKDLPLACWTPVDHEPAPPKVIDFFRRTGARPIAMSRFGERMLADAELEPLYVPHGVDTKAYRPADAARGRARIGVPDDAFLVGMVAANKGNNPPRKAFPQVLQAFAEIRKENPNAYLYLHSDPVGRQGVHLARLAELVGIDREAVRCPPQLQLEIGVPDNEMADLFCAFDVLVNPSYGEGFGVPIVEAQACGTPVIVTNGTAMTELCGSGWLVHGEPWFDVAQSAFYTIPSVRGIAEAMRAAYIARDDVAYLNKARAFATGYDANTVMRDYWQPALEQLVPNRELVAA